MAIPIDIVAQRSMDLFYQNYKSNSDFFELEDFQAHCAAVLGSVYQQGYEKMRAEMRQEGRNEIISFEPEILLEQELEVVNEKGILSAILKNPVMSFPYDEQGIGVQLVFDPTRPDLRFERTTAASVYQLQYVPVCDVVWWYMKSTTLVFINKSRGLLGKIIASTVPSVSDPTLMVPDGVAEYIITVAAQTIKEAGKNTVVKKSMDGNPNKVLQTEADLSALK